MKNCILFPLAGVACFFLASCSKPEDKIVNHIEKIEYIMNSNMDKPVKGVHELMDYVKDNGPDAMSEMAELGIELASIEGNGDREKRVKQVKEVIETPMKNLKGTMEKFGEEVGDDKEAKRLVEDFMKRWEALGEEMEMNFNF